MHDPNISPQTSTATVSIQSGTRGGFMRGISERAAFNFVPEQHGSRAPARLSLYRVSYASDR
jgi:hypothetical protein